MHPDIARQLAAERQADLQRDASSLPAHGRPRRSRKLRPALVLAYARRAAAGASAATGPRSGT
jgi:hypothetical protein